MSEVSPSIEHEATHRSEVPDPLPPRRIGFIVDGDTDKLLVETLGRKVLSPLAPPPCLATVRVYGSPWVRYIFPELSWLLEKGCDKVLAVFDTETEDPREIDSLLAGLQVGLARWRMLDKVDLVPVTPDITRWLLADNRLLEQVPGALELAAHLREARDPRWSLQHLSAESQAVLETLISRLDPERLRAQEPSFDRFARALEGTLVADSREAAYSPLPM